MESTIAIINDEIKRILMQHTGNINNPETCELIKKQLDRYFIKISEKLGYPYLPVVKAEIDGPFLTLNFFSDSGARLETFGDLVYYMDTGKVQTNVVV